MVVVRIDSSIQKFEGLSCLVFCRPLPEFEVVTLVWLVVVLGNVVCNRSSSWL